MKSTRFEQFVSLLLVAAVVVVAANAWLAFRAEQVLADTEFWVAHTWEVIADLDQAIGLVKDAEAAARGYLITGDPRTLAPQQTAARLLPDQLAHLKVLVSDNPAQVESITQMAAVATQRMAMIDSTIAVRRNQGAETAFTMVRDGAGMAEMDRLRMLVLQCQQAEQLLLRRRMQQSAGARREARLTIAFASLLDVLFIILTLWSLGYERRLRNQASETAGRLEKLQAISDVGLTRLTVAELTDEMLARLRSVAAIDAVALCKWHESEPGDTTIEVTAAKGVDLPTGERFPVLEDSPIAQSSRSNRPVKLDGAEVGGLALPGFDHELLSVLILPLSFSSRVIGIVIAARRQPEAFSLQDEQLLSVVADRIAMAIERASLFEREQNARRLAEIAAAQVKLLNAELEERVRQRTAELEATNRELEAFSYSVSHDLRAPLRSVDGFSVALEEDYGELLTADGKHYLARIRAGVQRMGQLIDALLQLSRITRADIQVEPVALSELALEVAHELAQQNSGRPIQFVVQPGLSSHGDPRLLRAVFENMLGNAVKFTARVAEPRIEFGYSPQRGAYYIRDNGAGFDQQYASKLFVAFQRLHGDKDFKGSGIGLATVARVIRRHHGTMSAEGAIGKGATFWFTLSAAK